MRLALPCPPAWRETARGDVRVLAIEPGLVVEVSPLAALPDDPVGWARAQLEARDVTVATATTARGWPALRVEAVVGDERRLLVVLAFLEYCGAVRLVGPVALVDARKPELLAWVDTADLAWGEPPLTLAAIWAGVPRA